MNGGELGNLAAVAYPEHAGMAAVVISGISTEQGRDVALFREVPDDRDWMVDDSGLVRGEAYRRAPLCADAINVKAETGLTPSGLLAQVDRLHAALEPLVFFAAQMPPAEVGGPDWRGMAERALAALIDTKRKET